MNKRKIIRVCSVMLCALLAFQITFHYGFLAAGEEGEGETPAQVNPQLGFQNELYHGIKVFKNIYSNEEFVKGSGNRTPIRETNPQPGDIYQLNELGLDEFRLVLYGAQNKDDLYNASDRPPMPGVKYQRGLGSILYYTVNHNKREGGKSYDLIVAPKSMSEYFLYYSNGDGTIDIVFDSETDSFYRSTPAEDPPTDEQKAEYESKTYHEKFLMDGAHYSANGSAAMQSLFAMYQSATSDFFTGAVDGSFFVFDGDVAYFDQDALSSSRYVRVREEWEFIRDLNEKRAESSHASQYTGEYVYMIEDDVLTDVTASTQSDTLEVANRFDVPIHQLTVSKTVPFFGVAPSDTNPFINTDVFEYKLLINEEVPDSIEYRIFNTKTNEIRPTESEADRPNVVQYGDEYRYVTKNGSFTLYAEESATFYGVKSGDTVEIREYTDPDSYSVLSRTTGGAAFSYVKAKDSTETPKRDYASITVQYGTEIHQRKNPTFTNVPNVLQVKKRVEAAVVDVNVPFEFTIQRLLPDPADPDKPYKYDGAYVADREFVLDDGGDPIPELDSNDQVIKDESGQTLYQTSPLPAQTYTYYLRDGDNNYYTTAYSAENGSFTLKHDQTAMFTGLKADSFYLVTESGDPAYDLVGLNERVLRTRGDTVDDPLIRSRSVNYYELFTNIHNKLTGIVITKKVRDSDNRLNKSAEYTMRIEKRQQNGTYVPVRNQPFFIKDGLANDVPGTTDENGYFKMRYNVSNYSVKFPTIADGTYRITEVDPNDFLDANNTIGARAPNPAFEDHFYITDVDYSEYRIGEAESTLDIEHPTAVHNDDPNVHTDDISVVVACSQTKAAAVDFTNRIREKTYCFDIEKLVYLDDNIHNTSADSTRRFQFMIERFASMEDALKGDSVLETFMTDICCSEKFLITNAGSEAYPVYTYKSGGADYLYPFDAINYTSNGEHVEYGSEIVTRTYTKSNTQPAYANGEQETYTFLSTIYRGVAHIAVEKQGYYKITEITDWSGANYDFCTGTNVYKGYLDETYTTDDQHELAKNRLFADYKTTHESGYDLSSGQLDTSVIIYAGSLSDSAFPYTLGCDKFDEQTASVSYSVVQNADRYIQKRDANGNLVYLDANNQETTLKYAADGTRNTPVDEPLSSFRIAETAEVNGIEEPLYFDAQCTEPVYVYSILPDTVNFETEETTDEQNNPITVPKKYTTVYTSTGEYVTGEYYKLTTAAAANENNFAHSSNVFSTQTITAASSPDTALRPMASFSNVESKYAILDSGAWAVNVFRK